MLRCYVLKAGTPCSGLQLNYIQGIWWLRSFLMIIYSSILVKETNTQRGINDCNKIICLMDFPSNYSCKLKHLKSGSWPWLALLKLIMYHICEFYWAVWVVCVGTHPSGALPHKILTPLKIRRDRWWNWRGELPARRRQGTEGTCYAKRLGVIEQDQTRRT